MNDEPRAKTIEEMRKEFLDHIKHLCDYWRTVPLSPELDNAQWRMEGLVHSILVTLDGGSMATPAFDLVPSPHPSDEQYCRDEGENWWTREVINECQLHDAWGAMLRECRTMVARKCGLT